MRKSKKNSEGVGRPNRPPALSIEARENQMISLAIDLAEQQLMDGTASSQVITHYLKLGSSKDRLEKELMEKQKELMNAKTDNIKASQRNEEFYKEVMTAIKHYNGEYDEYDEADVQAVDYL